MCAEAKRPDDGQLALEVHGHGVGIDALVQIVQQSCELDRFAGMNGHALIIETAYLLAIPALLDIARSRIVAGAAIAIFAIAFVNLMHFSQGWVQFGYRFSNDFAPFALLLVALGIAAIGRIRGWVAALIAISIAVNFWGVAWGNILGW